MMNYRSIASILIIAVLLAGCADPGRTNKSALTRQVTSEAVFINGLASIVPGIGAGLRQMSRDAGARLARSYATPIAGEALAGLISKSLIERWEEGRLTGPISLIGHSYGAIVATRVARRLNTHTPPIPIAYIAIIEGPGIEPIYGNVARVDNFRPAIGGIGDDLEIDPSFTGCAGDFRIERVGHVSIAIRLEVVERIIDQIREAEKQ